MEVLNHVLELVHATRDSAVTRIGGDFFFFLASLIAIWYGRYKIFTMPKCSLGSIRMSKVNVCDYTT